MNERGRPATEATVQGERLRTIAPDAVVLLLIVAVFNWLALFLFSRTAMLDFSALYTAGFLVVEGHRKQLFDLAVQADFQRRVLGMPATLPFFHVAYEALIFAPLALLPFRAALWVWRLISIGMLVLSCNLLSKAYEFSRGNLTLIAVAMFPVALTVVQGQDSMLLLLLFSATLLALDRGDDGIAGLLLSGTLFKPQLVLPVLVLLVWKRGLRFLAGFIAGGVGVLILSLGLAGRHGTRGMVDLMNYAISPAGDEIGANAWAQSNLRGLIGLLRLGTNATLVATAALSAILMVAIAWRLRGSDDARRFFPPLIAVTLLIGLHVNLHDFTLLLIPVLVMLEMGTRRAALCAGACFCMPVFMFMGHFVFFLLIVAVLVATISIANSDRRSRQAGELVVGNPIKGRK